MNLYVSNLSFEVSEAELKNLFNEFGQVTSAKLINDRVTGQSRGFGFVEMATDQAGRDAIQSLNEKEVNGRAIAVSIAKDKVGGDNRNFMRSRNPWK